VRAEPLLLRGVTLLWPDIRPDERGEFHRVLDVVQLEALGLDSTVNQVSVATNTRAGTVRGLHYQAEPHGETKTLWCHSGSVFDVLVDLRDDEPTYGEWVSVVLDAATPVALHVPRGIAHGYQTLEDDTALTYVISTPYVAGGARSLNWQDPTLGIDWPQDLSMISARDREAPRWPPSR
jgi:dTDP-4-dehydrorhamnose 3,5-epimerase